MLGILGISWAYLGHILGISLAYFEHILGKSRVYFGHILGISWAYLGHILVKVGSQDWLLRSDVKIGCQDFVKIIVNASPSASSVSVFISKTILCIFGRLFSDMVNMVVYQKRQVHGVLHHLHLDRHRMCRREKSVDTSWREPCGATRGVRRRR